MKTKPTTVAKLIIVITQIFLTLAAYPSLPSSIPTHWNFRGQIDSYSPKSFGAWIIPLITLTIAILFHFIPNIDPNKKKYQLFKTEWNIIQLSLVTFFAYLQLVILYASIYPRVNVTPFITTGIGALFVLMGNYLSKIRQNYFLGIRTPWTLASEHVWNKTHRFASWSFVLSGLAIMVGTLFDPPFSVMLLILMLVGSLLPALYSLFVYKNQEKLFFLGLYTFFGVFLALSLARILSGPEDTWICQHGQWVKHGNPIKTQPDLPCN